MNPSEEDLALLQTLGLDLAEGCLAPHIQGWSGPTHDGSGYTNWISTDVGTNVWTVHKRNGGRWTTLSDPSLQILAAKAKLLGYLS